jgi:hypothetical protein
MTLYCANPSGYVLSALNAEMDGFGKQTTGSQRIVSGYQFHLILTCLGQR